LNTQPRYRLDIFPSGCILLALLTKIVVQFSQKGGVSYDCCKRTSHFVVTPRTEALLNV